MIGALSKESLAKMEMQAVEEALLLLLSIKMRVASLLTKSD